LANGGELLSLMDLQLLNFLTLVTEFAAVALALEHMNISPAAGVPLAACALMLLVLTGSYRRWERIVVFLCLLDLAWFALAFYSHPAPGEVLGNTFAPSIPAGGLTASLVYLVIGIVGPTIAPWQLFFQQSCIADKRLRFADLKWARLGHTDRCDVYDRRRRLHDDDRQCRVAPRIRIRRSGTDGRGPWQRSGPGSGQAYCC
jgi:Mn2+/Fe2+ NRAMP family transporter